MIYSWHSVGVLDYNPVKKLYLVHKADLNGRVRDSKGKPILRSKERAKGKPKTQTPFQMAFKLHMHFFLPLSVIYVCVLYIHPYSSCCFISGIKLYMHVFLCLGKICYIHIHSYFTSMLIFPLPSSLWLRCFSASSQQAHGSSSLLLGQYWVPRILVQFSAEDPRVFTQRVLFAQCWRKNTEALLFYHLAIDSMPVWDGMPSLGQDSLTRIKKHVLSSPGLQLKL